MQVIMVVQYIPMKAAGLFKSLTVPLKITRLTGVGQYLPTLRMQKLLTPHSSIILQNLVLPYL